MVFSVGCLAAEIESLHALLLARLDAHDAYHRQNEHRWGLLKLAARYPFRLAALAILLTSLLYFTDANSSHLLKILTRLAAQILQK